MPLQNERYSVKGDIHKTVYTCRDMAHCLVNDYVADILVRDIYRENTDSILCLKEP